MPEIALTPQLVEGLRRRFNQPIALLHSARPAKQKEKDWLAACQGRAPIVLGTRSAVLVPMQNLGLIIVDEEHDPSYKQQEGLPYSARDMALVRAQKSHCPILLGSATPSLESVYNAQSGRYHLIQLTRRATQNAQLPSIELIDIRNQTLKAGLSPLLLQSIQDCLDRNQQAMIFLNRRGYAPVLYCTECHWIAECAHCDTKMTLHQQKNKMICHHCHTEQPWPKQCPNCRSDMIKALGQGTEQLEQVLKQQFDAPLLRIDRDTIQNANRLEQLFDQIRRQPKCILIGTQMLAKGHHFPQVSLVGLVNIDGGLFSIDFRAPERTMQLLMQVAGRAGRGQSIGRVMVQTRFPDHPFFHALLKSDYMQFAQQTLLERQAAGLPPFSYQALFRASSPDPEQAEQFLNQLRHYFNQSDQKGWTVFPVIPALNAKRADQYRFILMLQSQSRPILHQIVQQGKQYIQTVLKPRLRWRIDMDPLEF